MNTSILSYKQALEFIHEPCLDPGPTPPSIPMCELNSNQESEKMNVMDETEVDNMQEKLQDESIDTLHVDTLIQDFFQRLQEVAELDVTDPEYSHRKEDYILHSFIDIVAGNDPPPLKTIQTIARHIQRHLSIPSTRWYA